MKRQAINKVKSLLLARRSNDVHREQLAHQSLVRFCHKHNLDFNNVLDGATREIRSSISGAMNSL